MSLKNCKKDVDLISRCSSNFILSDFRDPLYKFSIRVPKKHLKNKKTTDLLIKSLRSVMKCDKEDEDYCSPVFLEDARMKENSTFTIYKPLSETERKIVRPNNLKTKLLEDTGWKDLRVDISPVSIYYFNRDLDEENKKERILDFLVTNSAKSLNRMISDISIEEKDPSEIEKIINIKFRGFDLDDTSDRE